MGECEEGADINNNRPCTAKGWQRRGPPRVLHAHLSGARPGCRCSRHPLGCRPQRCGVQGVGAQRAFGGQRVRAAAAAPHCLPLLPLLPKHAQAAAPAHAMGPASSSASKTARAVAVAFRAAALHTATSTSWSAGAEYSQSARPRGEDSCKRAWGQGWGALERSQAGAMQADGGPKMAAASHATATRPPACLPAPGRCASTHRRLGAVRQRWDGRLIRNVILQCPVGDNGLRRGRSGSRSGGGVPALCSPPAALPPPAALAHGPTGSARWPQANPPTLNWRDSMSGRGAPEASTGVRVIISTVPSRTAAPAAAAGRQRGGRGGWRCRLGAGSCELQAWVLEQPWQGRPCEDGGAPMETLRVCAFV